VPAAQRLLLDIIDMVRGPLVAIDADLRITHVNRAFCQTFRLEREETVGAEFFTLGDGRWDIPPLRALLGEQLAQESEVSDVEVDHEFPVIGRKIMLLNARVMAHGPSLPRMILLSMEDITERRLTEWRLAEQRLELQRSNTALDEFAAVASHDLQEPLRKILSFGDLLSSSAGSTLDDVSKAHLARVLDAATRMRTLISDLLLYSQVSTRAHVFVTTDLGRIAHEVITDLETSITDAGGRVEVEAMPVIEADPLQMRQLLQNLIGNAIKYRRPDAPPVVRLRGAVNGGSRCTITVADNGIGFNEQHKEKIFRMFLRLHNRSQYEGSGIGLALCRKIVERHRGSIAAMSTAGAGSTFTVTLPVTHSAPGSKS